MQIVSSGDNLHEMLNPVFWEKKEKNIINLPSAENAQKMVQVKPFISCIAMALTLKAPRKTASENVVC